MDYLPIGSVVLLKGGTKKVMIYGRIQRAGRNGKIYDYLGAMYPEGYAGEKYQILFNHGEIEKVIFKGYSDDEEERYLEKIKNYQDEINKLKE
ncbi:DUF4176 domain-containing protein [Fonticella tunisiensis]|uniref:DUF4176 domain-containing protein n=1 Tax=Fonticella tunisiensis TaxID=1096341 RepID=A0A4R7KBY3_9CLOT|nr:DUF4176 domain-containing protein [Fonticella tunisiensis]TDT51986.1 hypothetical protein EDD71_11517 [Fonticella tunisiensis]